jgi:gliding motility-associated-like protein
VSGTDPTECGAFDGTIIISGLVPNENYEYNYNNTGLQNATSNANGEIIITGLNAGSYSDFIVIWNGCETPDNTVISLVDPNAPFVDAGPDIIVCDGEEVTLIADNPDGAIITWDNGVTDGNPFTQPVGTVTYTVTADLDNCISTDQMTVTVNPLPNVSAGNNVIVCEGESVILTGSGAQSYTWDNGVVNGQSFTPTETTTYTVTGTSADGCENTDQVIVEVDILPEVGFEVDSPEGCVPITATFTPAIDTAGDSCTWIMGDGTTIQGCDEFSHTYNTVGCFTVTLQTETANGCTSTQTQPNVVCVGGYPQAGFSYSPDQPSNILNTVNFTNGSVGATDFEWYFGDGETSTQTNPTHTYDEDPNEYEVTLVAISPFGCTDTARAILPLIEELIFYVPNTITPNNDGQNDVFLPVFTSGFDPLEYNLLIFNRWGEILFESNNAEIGWDATYGASSTEIVKDGTYVWKIEYRSNQTGRKEVVTGHVNVLR